MIRIEHLSKYYAEASFVLKDVSCTISKGEIVAIIGRSGCGKSTLLGCINKLQLPTSGHIYIDGENILSPECDITRLRRKVGMVFQDFHLFEHLNVMDNITLAPMKLLGLSRKEAEERAYQLLKMVGLANKAQAMPSSLSGGQKQRVAIARTLAMEPDVLLLDEPTSSLDPSMASEVFAVVQNISKTGITILMTTHRISEIKRFATRIILMSEGRILEDGPAEEILENPKTEEARAYIKRIKDLNIEIENSDFDLYEMNAEIATFCSQYFVSKKKLNSILHVTEEILTLLDKDKGVSLNMEYSETDDTILIKVIQKGLQESILSHPDVDPISTAMLQGFCRNISECITSDGVEISLHIF